MATRFEEPENRTGGCTEDLQNGTNRAQAAMDFEELLSDLSAAFVRVSVDQIDNEIERWLERIVLAMGVDRGTVIQLHLSDGTYPITHQWARDGVSAPYRGLRTSEPTFPWIDSKISSCELVIIPRVADLPPEASADRELLQKIGTKSKLTIPVRVGGTVVGALAFGAIVFEKHWSEQEVQRLKLVAEIFGNAFHRQRAEAEIRRLSEELRQASQVMTMGELTASLAHELSQPLGAILNNAKAARRLLTAKTPDLAEIDAALDDIIRDDGRAVDIVKNVRAMFKRGEAMMERIDVKELLLGVIAIVSVDARKKAISLSTELPDSLPSVRGDKTHLTQAVLNLVVNAFDSVCESDGKREVILRAGQEEPDQVHISVRDSGKGIDPNVLPKLFEPFFTTEPTGMGMGLTIVRSIIENHGGRIWATQASDHGATMEFVLAVEP